MFEILFCSLFTIVPDYLYRRYGQGRRFGVEITLYSVWYELRYGITACLMLTVGLITIVFYYHPSSTSVNALFRTVSILPEKGGRVAEIYLGTSSEVKKGQPIFRLDRTEQEAALEVAIRRIAQVDASAVMAQAELAAAAGQIQQAKGAYDQAVEELATKEELQRRSPGVVAQREIEKLQNLVEGRQGGVAAAEAAKQSAETRISTLIPAEKASAVAVRDQAQVDLSKTTVYAGVDGRVEQFVLRVGDYVSPVLRPAGILVPSDAGRKYLVAGFGQIEARVIKVGMAAEVTCISQPLTITPMVVTMVQDYIAAGQVRAVEQLLDPQQVIRPGTITAFLEPMYKDGLAEITPGSACIANAYSDHHDELASPDIGAVEWLYLHMVDAVALIHALILRLQALALPIKLLVLTGGH